MAIIGHFTPFKSETSGLEGFAGEISAQAVRGKFALKPNTEKRSDKSPDYTVLIERSGTSGFVEWGMAWKKKPKDETKKEFISILLQPQGGQDLNVAAFPPDDAKKDPRWVITTGRPRGGAVSEEARGALPSTQAVF